MPGWLTWALVGLGVWVTASVPLAFLVGHLLDRRRVPRGRVVLLAESGSSRVRARSRTLTGSG